MHVMKPCEEEVEVYFHFLTLALDGGGWSAARLGRLSPTERAPDIR
jgi:hypothetical protein